MPDAHSLPMVVLYVLINFLGVTLIGVAISIYQRVNLVLHPADDLFQILRFRYFKGNATLPNGLNSLFLPRQTILTTTAILQKYLYAEILLQTILTTTAILQKYLCVDMVPQTLVMTRSMVISSLSVVDGTSTAKNGSRPTKRPTRMVNMLC